MATNISASLQKTSIYRMPSRRGSRVRASSGDSAIPGSLEFRAFSLERRSKELLDLLSEYLSCVLVFFFGCLNKFIQRIRQLGLSKLSCCRCFRCCRFRFCRRFLCSTQAVTFTDKVRNTIGIGFDLLCILAKPVWIISVPRVSLKRLVAGVLPETVKFLVPLIFRDRSVVAEGVSGSWRHHYWCCSPFRDNLSRELFRGEFCGEFRVELRGEFQCIGRAEQSSKED